MIDDLPFGSIPGLDSVIAHIQSMPIHAKVEAINQIRQRIHEVSPFKAEPVDFVRWIKSEKVHANDYNPNSVAPPEMKLLEISILEDGYTQPIVSFDEGDTKEVVDGFHRNRVGKESAKVRDRIHGYLPLVVINDEKTEKGDRIASTIRHNRARGKHKVQSMSDLVVDLKKRNWSDEKIARDLGMDPDEVLRLAQISGLAEMFSDREFSMAWEATEEGEI
jgi:ParB-like chromosome segregation protein Spo0J